MTSLEQKQAARLSLLQKLYDLTEGVSDQHGIDIEDLGPELGMSRDDISNAYRYLVNEGLATDMALGDIGTISHAGVREVEKAHQMKPSDHFLPLVQQHIYHISNVHSPNAQIVSGQNATASMNVTLSVESTVRQLRQKLEDVESTLPAEAEDLLDVATREESNAFHIAKRVESLAQKGNRWSVALKEFAEAAAANATGGLVVEAIKLYFS